MSKTWLYKTDPLMRGPAVRRYQELLDAGGFALPKWGADGSFGDETNEATTVAQETLRAAGLYSGALDNIVGPRTLNALHQYAEAKKPAAEALADPMSVIDGVEVHDYRGRFAPPKNARTDWGNRWPKRTGVMLHRTACRMGERPQRYAAMNAHVAMTLGGRIILVHPWDLHIWHGNRPSLWTIGIEFDGNPSGYPAKNGRPAYYWKPGGGPDPITPGQVKASRVLLRLLLDAFKKNGAPFKYVYAHRQSSENRECDPGWMAWRDIGIPWMQETGAVPGDANGWGGSTFGTGFQIPKVWDPRSPARGFRDR